jgi:hypothetical protein
MNISGQSEVIPLWPDGAPVTILRGPISHRLLPKALAANCTNEGGVFGTTRFLKQAATALLPH